MAYHQTWQDKLADACREYKITAPVFQIVSDRRGGRTAWSSTVTVYNQVHSARFWYDGKNVNNAKEDAAEVALTWLGQSSSSSSSSMSSMSAASAGSGGSPATSASSPATSRGGGVYW